MIIQIIGLPGSGKTILSQELAKKINAIHLNADEVRADLNKDLGFSPEDRVEQSRRMGALARLLSKQGHIVIADFVCPNKEARIAFGDPSHLIWVDRIKESRFEDTNKLWHDPIPQAVTLRIQEGMSVKEEVDLVMKTCNLFDWSAPTTLQLGRYQPWHEGHQALKEEAHKRTDQVLVGVRSTFNTSEKDPLVWQDVYALINNANPEGSNTKIMKLPNITNIVYGRDVGYKIEQVDLGADIHAISATQKRKEMGI
jgi:adenylylsulfate kinase